MAVLTPPRSGAGGASRPYKGSPWGQPGLPAPPNPGMSSPWATSLLLMAAWTMGCGEAFRCYACSSPTPIHSCKNITQCKQEDTACKTTLETVESEYPFSNSPMVTRSCSSSCLATDPDSIGAAHPIFCCFRDLCNAVGVIRPGPGVLALLGASLLSHLLP